MAPDLSWSAFRSLFNEMYLDANVYIKSGKNFFWGVFFGAKALVMT
jgi:hypothetical protein